MGPDHNAEASGNPPTWQPPPAVPDFFATGAVVMPPPEPGSPALAPVHNPPPPSYGQIPWGVAQSRRPSKRRLVFPSALTAGAVVIGAVLVATFGMGKSGGAALTNAQLLNVVHAASSGLTRAPATTFTMTETISAEGRQHTIDISGVVNTHSQEGSFTMSGEGVDESVLAVDGVVYMKVPATTLSMSGGKPWIGVRTPAPTAAQQQFESSGPAGLLQTLAKVGGAVQDKGAHAVDGVETTEYSVDVDMTSLIDTEEPQLAQSMDVKGLGLGDAPMTIWIDHNGLPRQLSLDVSISGISINETAHMTPTSVMPTISAPPASEVDMFNSFSDFESSIEQLYGS